MEKMEELRNLGRTIIFISHSLGQIRSFCEEGIWIENGVLRMQGEINEVADAYEVYVDEFKALAKEEKKVVKQKNMDERIVK